MKPAQLKKMLAAITSVLGNIEAHFPDTKQSFVQALQTSHPELFALAVEKGVIGNADSVPLAVATDEGLTEAFIASLFVRSPELFALGMREMIIPSTYFACKLYHQCATKP